MINKSKIYEIFAGIRRASEENLTLVVEPKNGILKVIPLSANECDRIEKTFIETRKIIDFTVCEIAEIFTIGKAACEFKDPGASEIKSVLIGHFEHQNSIIFQVKDEDGHLSLYHYHRMDVGDPNKIVANHKTVYFETGRCFYTKNIAGIVQIKEVLLN